MSANAKVRKAQRPRIRRIGIVVKQRAAHAAPLLRELIQWFDRQGLRYLFDRETGALLKDRRHTVPRHLLPRKTDLIIVFGGDGTLLSMVRVMNGASTPILGVNLGALGFLTELHQDELFPSLRVILSGQYRLDERLMLAVEIRRKNRKVASYRALNDAVINKAALARMVDLDVFVDRQFVSSFRSDGMIVATPTGSTAYSLSAGGPIVYPGMRALLITPICPHTLTNRPLLVSDLSRIEVVLKSGEDVYLTVDGQEGMPLQPGDKMMAFRSKHTVRLIEPVDKNYFDVLREKLKWGGR